MVVEVIGCIVLCVVVFSLPSYRFVTVLHVVSRCCSGYVHACELFVTVVFVYVGAIFVSLGMALDSVAFRLLLQVLLLDARLSNSFQNVRVGGLNLCLRCCWCCWCRRPVVVVAVDRVFIFVGDGHGISQADSSMQCRIRVCAQAEDLPFACWRFSFGGSCFPWR